MNQIFKNGRIDETAIERYSQDYLKMRDICGADNVAVFMSTFPDSLIETEIIIELIAEFDSIRLFNHLYRNSKIIILYRNELLGRLILANHTVNNILSTMTKNNFIDADYVFISACKVISYNTAYYMLSNFVVSKEAFVRGLIICSFKHDYINKKRSDDVYRLACRIGDLDIIKAFIKMPIENLTIITGLLLSTLHNHIAIRDLIINVYKNIDEVYIELVKVCMKHNNDMKLIFNEIYNVS